MTYLLNNFRRGFGYVSSDKGITLIELMVAMGVAGIVLMAIYSAYHTQTLMNRKQTVVLNMQQNLRGGLFLMEREIRMAGYDQNNTGNFGITSISDVNGNSSITFTADLNEDGVLTADDTISFSMYDSSTTPSVGMFDLGMAIGAGSRQLAAESIEALFLAYAYDNDEDGLLQTSAGGNIIWAIDSNNDNILDTDVNTGAAIGGAGVPVGSIRAVMVWLLARTKTPMLKETDNNTYNVGNRTITPNDYFKRELLVTTIKCRNLGMN